MRKVLIMSVLIRKEHSILNIISTFLIISTPFFSNENGLIWGRGRFLENKNSLYFFNIDFHQTRNTRNIFQVRIFFPLLPKISTWIPNKHFSNNNHTFFGLTKMCLSWVSTVINIFKPRHHDPNRFHALLHWSTNFLHFAQLGRRTIKR